MFYQTNHSTELSMGFTDKIRRDTMHINNTSRVSTWTATETSSSGRFWPVVVVFHETHVLLLYHLASVHRVKAASVETEDKRGHLSVTTESLKRLVISS